MRSKFNPIDYRLLADGISQNLRDCIGLGVDPKDFFVTLLTEGELSATWRDPDGFWVSLYVYDDC